MPGPSTDSGKCKSRKGEARNIMAPFSQHISRFWRAAETFSRSLKKKGPEGRFLNSQDKMEGEALEGSRRPHPKPWSQLLPGLCPTTWILEGNRGGSDRPFFHYRVSSNRRAMNPEPSKDGSPALLHRGRLGLSAASVTEKDSPMGQVEEEEYSCAYGSFSYLFLCSLGGVVSCGATHTAVVPLDVVKCRMQVEPRRYLGLVQGLSLTVREEGMRGLAKGWAPTAIGYSMQGFGKFGLYEFFKIQYSDLMGPEEAYLWRTSLYLAASASAEFFADMALAPMEAVKVRIQTQRGYANTLREAVPKMYIEEGLWAFYKGVYPLWMRQIPYTMMKFSCFERTVEALYKYVIPKPRDKCSKMEQLGVTFIGGYIAGIFCAIVSHPADSVVSVLNKEKGSTAVGVLKRLGMYGIWKGLFTRILMIGTLTGLQWFIYDLVKVYLKLPRPPPPEMPESLKKKLSKN
ncbi:solute carrier family 25 member 3-like [Candoia aspera]|uniref:solute carrier family 25 member 3-like n=1 Tax=Candoia aspera TaxID=51853 RepID=UPI002FD7E38C